MHNDKSVSSISTRYIPAPNWEKHHEWPRPKVGGLRNLIFNRYTNGFDKVIKKVGKRILIDEAAFFNWINEQSKQGG
ncbi:hypothetical protein [Rickettsiella massiliensis]|uniref:hypothetical protein n=1 Tax=Rickettsiella massiliensis TaxID=676517 RepID=UPI00029A9BC1|nr:hypothetical protein [Rickettsiella massiliensis]